MWIGRFFTHRYTLAFINLVLLVILSNCLWEAFSYLTDAIDNAGEIEDVLDGLGAIFVAYGVALEERETLMRIFRLYPRLQNRLEEAVDHVCHVSGLLLLIVGLFMEVTVEAVKLPNRILNTQGVEGWVFGTGFFFGAIAAGLLIHMAVKLLFVKGSRHVKL
ncbi:MAG: hypothetical protein V1816_11815 [Pseudomonadota bacterium]